MSNATLAAPSEAILNARDELASFESGASAVSWGAIVAGAVVASALSLALLMLGAGIGLVSVSPWSTTKVSVTTFGILAAAWFIAVQLFASGGRTTPDARTDRLGQRGAPAARSGSDPAPDRQDAHAQLGDGRGGAAPAGGGAVFCQDRTNHRRR